MEEWSIVLGLAATVVPTAAVIVTALIQHRANRDAHSGIVERIETVDARAEKRTQAAEECTRAAEERAEKRTQAAEERTRAAEERAEKRTQAAEERAERRADALAATLDAQRQALEAIARDLSFLAGRQAERDRSPDRDAGGGVR